MHHKQPSTPDCISNILSLDLSLLDWNLSSLTPKHYFVTPNTPDIDIIFEIATSSFNSHILLFLTKSRWVCSVDVDTPMPQEPYVEHF